jgi:hypothetical protein
MTEQSHKGNFQAQPPRVKDIYNLKMQSPHHGADAGARCSFHTSRLEDNQYRATDLASRRCINPYLTFSGHRGTVDGKYGIVYDIQMEQDPPGIQRCQLPATQGCRLAAIEK